MAQNSDAVLLQGGLCPHSRHIGRPLPPPRATETSARKIRSVLRPAYSKEKVFVCFFRYSLGGKVFVCVSNCKYSEASLHAYGKPLNQLYFIIYELLLCITFEILNSMKQLSFATVKFLNQSEF